MPPKQSPAAERAAADLAAARAEIERLSTERDVAVLAKSTIRHLEEIAKDERDKWKARWQAKADAFEVQEQTIAVLRAALAEAQRERGTNNVRNPD
jgi:hypothetical protein